MNPANIHFHNCYRELILKGTKPLIIQEPLNWEILEWNLHDWLNIFQDDLLNFRCGKRQCQKFPIWEGQCELKSSTFETFIQFCNDEEATKKEWRYFDYKHLAEYFDNPTELFKSLSWKNVGFPEKGAESSTLWIGSPGAHTPCHVDTYGSNIVVQVYGRKRWFLFPYSETDNLQPTRVPYEESSIFSNLNFFCSRNLTGISLKNCYKVDLNPGDILFVPPKWWHYVENLSTAISINTWIPHVDDNGWRLNEGLVRFFMSSIVNKAPENMRKRILNPNEDDIEDNSQHLQILKFCKEREINSATNEDYGNFLPDYHMYGDMSHHHEYKLIKKTSQLIDEEMMKHHSNCTTSELENNELQDDEIENLVTVINAFCHPNIISEVKNKLMKS